MKKLLLILTVAAIGCKSSADKANNALDSLLVHQNKLDYYMSPTVSEPVFKKMVDDEKLLIDAYKTIFENEIDKVSNEQDKLELIKKFDRIYVLRIEK